MPDTPTDAEALAAELDKRVVTRWVHAVGDTPHQSGHKPDAMCRNAATMLRTLSAERDGLRARLAALEAERAAGVPAGMVQIGWGVRASIDPPQAAALWAKRPAPDDIAFMESTGGISVIVEPVYMPAAPTPTPGD